MCKIAVFHLKKKRFEFLVAQSLWPAPHVRKQLSLLPQEAVRSAVSSCVFERFKSFRGATILKC